MTEINLTVQPLRQQDVQRNIAALTRDVMDKLGVNGGDYIVIRGDTETVARVWPGYDEDKGEDVIRIDGRTRSRAGASISESVEVEPTEVKPADSITIALPQQFRISGAEHLFRDKLKGEPIQSGVELRIPVGFGGGPNQALPAKVTETDPDGFVTVTESTDINISDTPLEQVADGDSESNEVPDVTYEDIGGLDKELERVREMIELPMRHSELFNHLGIEPPKGVLLHGPPGTGKTLLAKAVANEVDASFHNISGPEIMSRFYGESEERLREIFEEASESAPAIIFIDELDSIAPSRDESGEVEQRIVAQLLSLMDGLEDRGDVVVIGATNRVDAIDNALRRGGRFDREIEIGVPDKQGRKEVFQIHTRSMPLNGEVDLDEYAEKTYGFVGADIESMTKEAAMAALRRIRPELDLEAEEIPAEVLNALEVTPADFKTAMKETEPSAMREVFVEVPDVTWNDVGGLTETKDKLQETVQWPLDYPQVFEQMDMNAAKGILMYGPPGTGKTLLAKAVANEADSNFISVKGPELLDKYVGESEKGIREIFSKARENAPTVIFFDEIDAIAGERGRNTGDAGVGERVVSQLLTELDGLENLDDVVVIATSNRPDLIDNALLRPGRLDRHVHVPVPDEAARRKIFEVHTRNKPVADDLDTDRLARETEGFVGADIEAICREASMAASREFINSTSPDEVDEKVGGVDIEMRHFEEALSEVVASVDAEVKEQYDEIEQQMEKSEPETKDEGQRRTAFQ